MKKSSSLRPVECVVIIVTIVFALMVAVAVCGNSRTYADQAECMSKLCRWAAVIHTINDSRAGQLPLLTPEIALYPNLLKCPSTRDDPNRPAGEADWGGTTTTYQFVDDANRVDTASYGFNYWIMSSNLEPLPGQPNHVDRYSYPSNAPLMLDSMWLGGWPKNTDNPPLSPDSKPSWWGQTGTLSSMINWWQHMTTFVMDRHSGGVHSLFLDDSVRRIKVQDLWRLSWYSGFNAMGPWTPQGGVQPTDWPEWLRPYGPQPPVPEPEGNGGRG